MSIEARRNAQQHKYYCPTPLQCQVSGFHYVDSGPYLECLKRAQQIEHEYRILKSASFKAHSSGKFRISSLKELDKQLKSARIKFFMTEKGTQALEEEIAEAKQEHNEVYLQELEVEKESIRLLMENRLNDEYDYQINKEINEEQKESLFK